MLLTTKEIDAIRFYQGDLRKRGADGQILKNENNKDFYGTPSAYRTMNCLMFDGITNEIERIKEKNGKLISELLLEVDKIIEVYCDIYRAMCKSVSELKETKKKMLLYRTDRGVSVQELKKGYTISFTSTSKEDKPEKFLQKKVDLTLLNFVLPSEIPHLDFQKVLGKDYLFEQQKEILLPPFLEIELQEMELTDKEKEYKDENNRPPAAKYLVIIKGIVRKNPELENRSRNALTSERNKRAAEILGKLIKKEQLTEEEKEEYCLWKKDVRTIIWEEFRKIRENYLCKESGQKEHLIADVNKTLLDFNRKRKLYKNRIRIYNTALIITKTIPLACISLSFMESIQFGMKIAAVITSTISILLSQILKVEVYDTKLMQRSKTYLALCDLSREIKYESNWNREKEVEYIKKFRDIMKADSVMSLNNLQIQAKNLEMLYQDDTKMNK